MRRPEISAGQSDVQSFVYKGSDLIYRQFPGNAMTALNQPDFEKSGNGMLYLYGPTGLVAEFDRFGYNSRTLIFDPQGSFVSSSNGAYFQQGNGIKEGTSGLPVWSPPAPNASPPVQNLATSQPFQYKGQYGYYTDGASGLIYCQHRYYDPNTGRWTERDPTGLDGGVNIYQYVNGDPVMGSDPSGLDGRKKKCVIIVGDTIPFEFDGAIDNATADHWASQAKDMGYDVVVKAGDSMLDCLDAIRDADFLILIGHGSFVNRHDRRHPLRWDESGIRLHQLPGFKYGERHDERLGANLIAKVRGGRRLDKLFVVACGQGAVNFTEGWCRTTNCFIGFEGGIDVTEFPNNSWGAVMRSRDDMYMAHYIGPVKPYHRPGR